MMSENTIYHVIPTGARWKVIGEGTAPTYYTSEEEAVTTAREWAMTHEPSHVVIHKIDGSIEEEHLMKMDSFPHAPSGSSYAEETPARRPSGLSSRMRERSHGENRARGDEYSRRNGASL